MLPTIPISPRADAEPEKKTEDYVRKRVDAAGETEDAGGAVERLKRHRREMAGRVRIPDTWGQEKLLKEWADCAALDRALFPVGLMSARDALVDECRRAGTARVRVANSC